MNKIIFYTKAYNEEKHIRRAMDSVLSQTYSDFEYHVCDNGSTDGTRAVILDYAAKDKRVIPILCDKNELGVKDPLLLFVEQLQQNCEDGDYFVSLDADDKYKPTFLEEMLTFMEKYSLDIAACGTDMEHAETGVLHSVRKLNDNMILEGEGFGKYFPGYYQFMRTVWGKVYKVFTLKNYSPNSDLINGADTHFVFHAVRNASRVGILAKSLHKYYVSQKSVSRVWNGKRVNSDRILYDTAIDYLSRKVGFVSPLNREFLFGIYFLAIRDTCNVLFGSKIGADEKLAALRVIFTTPQTRELAGLKFPNNPEVIAGRDKLFNAAADWIFSVKETRRPDNMEKAAEILAAIGVIPASFGGLSDAEAFRLSLKIYGYSNSPAFKRRLGEQIIAVASKKELLAGLSAEFLVFFHDIAVAVFGGDFGAALNLCEAAVSEEREIPAGSGLSLVTLGLNLAAKLEKTEYFVFFKKLRCSLLLDAGQKEQAAEELADWDEIMPGDEDFKELRLRINQRL